MKRRPAPFGPVGSVPITCQDVGSTLFPGILAVHGVDNAALAGTQEHDKSAENNYAHDGQIHFHHGRTRTCSPRTVKCSTKTVGGKAHSDEQEQ